MNIKITKTTNPKARPTDESALGFGKIFTDHMFIMNYDEGKGWHSPRIEPYAPLSLDPATAVLHYGQEVFEGLKAYRTADGRVTLFRPQENFKRLNVSNERLCIPNLNEQDALEGLKALVEIDKEWIPTSDGTSLYIRPFIISTDAMLGVHPGHHYMFIIILSPVGSYYSGGLTPVDIYIENEYVRAVKGGTGVAKTGGNYAATLKAQDIASKDGFGQGLWLDGIERKYIEEVGAMNVMFKIGDKIVTPELSGSILAGITRKSCIELMKDWGMEVEERKISIQELADAYDKGLLKEAFGTGTAAVISPIGKLKWGDKVMEIGTEIGEVAGKLYNTVTGIQTGKLTDKPDWVVDVCKF